MRCTVALAVLLALPPALSAGDKEPDSELKFPPAKPHRDDGELRRLQKERYNAALEILQLEMLRVKAGQSQAQLLGEAVERVVVAGLDMEPGPKERLALLEEAVRVSKDVEQVAAAGFDAGRLLKADLLRARCDRLRTEIRVQREKERGRK